MTKTNPPKDMPYRDEVNSLIDSLVTRETHKGSVNRVRHQAKARLTALIARGRLEGQIDEIRRLLLTGGVNIEVNEYGEKRIAELTAHKEELEG